MDWGDFSGGYTVSPGTQSDYGPDSTDSTSTDGTTGTGTGTAGDGTVGPADAYAPGVGQEPAGGGTGGSTGGGGGGTSGGVTPG